MMTDISFDQQQIKFGNGSTGESLAIRSANPANYHAAISTPEKVAPQDIHGKLFLPVPGSGPWPVVIVVPGSLGVAVSHLAHAETLTNLGIATCVIDPFGTRQVTSTVANQTQYSFAASAWDVLATARTLADHASVDNTRIGAQGHSRGGSAVITAATRQFAAATGAPVLRAVYAAYPWCGHQFQDPSIGDTLARAVIGDLDEWCLPQQVQGHIHAMTLTDGSATCRIFGQAHHSFDRETPVEFVPDAAISPGSPTCYIAEDGAFIHPVTGIADPKLTDRDLMIYGMKTGHGRKGAHIGTSGNQSAEFREDMVSFWQSALA